MRFIFTSDTHGGGRTRTRPAIPEGDVLIHSGDLTGRGTLAQLQDEANWLASLPHRHKIVVAGNHDWCLYRDHERALAERMLYEAGVTYLRDATEWLPNGMSVYGTPWVPEFCGWAFMRYEHDLEPIFDAIPKCDILVCHGPAHGVLDWASDGRPCGSPSLRRAVERASPVVFAFGHIHEGYGTQQVGPTTYINAACCDMGYYPVNPPIIRDLG